MGSIPVQTANFTSKVNILRCCVACKPLVYKRFVREPMRSFPENGELFLFFNLVKIEGFTVYEKFID